ncbi:glycoside hydrolase family 3 N-terminal domain-containing protein [Yinghuangia aomiensis]|uniref:Glycoside hydrolase family 3 N-terminal domain-containing protein n=1 Tax=Yinghuangia aomiensis TaxID=676205 RepID=A0ABP9I8Z0_9ACTN
MTTWSWSPDDIATLVSRLTVEQKVAQLGGLSAPDLLKLDGAGPQPEVDTGRIASLRPHGLGHLSMAWFLASDADGLRAKVAEVQAAVRDISPFGIGALVHNEGVNGFLHASATQFPTAWAQATTWDPELLRKAAAITSQHTRDAGMQLLLSPVMDINRDPRWGRVHETYGEDPELAAQFAVAFVRGIQGDDQDTGILATGKHFLGYGASEGGLNTAATQLGRRALLDEYAEPFRRAIADAGLAVMMNSYNEIDGIPASANRWLLTDLLRGLLGFDGMVVSDYDAVNLQRTTYHTAATHGEAAVQALSAGLDAELPGDVNYSHLVDEVAAGRLDERILDIAVARVLTAKARTGLIPGFSTPTAPTARSEPEHAATTRRAIAARGTVLLDNDGTLPLAADGRRIVVVGPAADELRIHFGAYTSVSSGEMPMGIMAVMEGRVPGVDPATFVFTDIFQTRMPGIEPAFEQAARSIHPHAPTVLEALRAHHPKTEYAPLGRFEADPEHPLDADAVAAAVNDADLVIAVVGERTGWVGNNTAGEGQSTASPTLPGDQEDLLAFVAATGKPLVTVVVSGRPLLLERAAQASNAVLLAPLLGEEAGAAVADTLFGTINPSGKLPSTFPRHVGQLPIYHGHHYGSGYDHPTGSRHGYGDLSDQGPLYPFGHGLSYSTFDVALDTTDGPAVDLRDGVVHARLAVTNTGTSDGETVLQLYARDEAATVVRPVRQLIQFRRVAAAAGQTQSVTLAAPIERLFYTLPDGRRGIEAGDITVMAGLSSHDIRCNATVTTPEHRDTIRPALAL